MLGRVGALVVVAAVLGCGGGGGGGGEDGGYRIFTICGNPYDVTTNYPTCPTGEPCSTPPAGEGCIGYPITFESRDLADTLGDAGIGADATFPVGCTMYLPWETSHGSQQSCCCGAGWPSQTGHDWVCLQ